jgi:hypothetical protein
VKFSAPIEILGVNPYVLVEAERARRLMADWRKPMPVRVQINGAPSEPWRINMMPRGDGSFYLYLHETVRSASRTKVGDVVHVDVEFDHEYVAGPVHDMPAAFEHGLDISASAKAAWDALNPSRKKEVLRYFANIKSEEALNRNIARALEALSGPKVRFMGRTWKDGK